MDAVRPVLARCVGTCSVCGATVIRARRTSGSMVELDASPVDRSSPSEWRAGVEVLAGRYWLHDVAGEDLPRARMLGPASTREERARWRHRPHRETRAKAQTLGPAVQLSLFGEREVERIVDLKPGDMVLSWWPAFGEWRRGEVLRLAPPEEALPCGRAIVMRDHYGEFTEFTRSFEDLLGIGNRLLPKDPSGWRGMSGIAPQTWRDRRKVEV